MRDSIDCLFGLQALASRLYVFLSPFCTFHARSWSLQDSSYGRFELSGLASAN